MRSALQAVAVEVPPKDRGDRMLPFLSPGLGRALWSFGLGFGATAAALGFMPFLLGGYREVAPVARYLPIKGYSFRVLFELALLAVCFELQAMHPEP